MEKPTKILAVDDNTTNLEIFEELLEDEFNLVTACSGEEALEIAERFQPDLILLDIMMPGIDGYEVCRRLRKNPSLKYTEVIMVTAKALTTERLEGYDVGADDYVTKPFDGDELLAKIRAFLHLKKIEEMEQIEEDFSETVTHEMRTPMTIAKNIISNAQEDTFGEISPKLSKQLNIVNDEMDRIARIISDFFDITRIETGDMELDETEFDITSLIFEIIEEFKNKATEKRIAIDTDIQFNGVLIWGDRKKIMQVMRHLVDNAVKFIDEEGTICIRVCDIGDKIRIDVEDDGPGINTEETNAIFSKFVQKINKVGPGQHGTGLGLAVSKGIVELHDGIIRAENKPEGGAIFSVEIPKQASLNANMQDKADLRQSIS